MTNIIFYTILFFLVFEFIVTKTLAYLNKTKWSETLPKEAKAIYDEKEYAKSMKYEKAKYNFSNISGIIFFVIILLAVSFGLFWKIYNFSASFGYSEIITNLIFFWILGLIQMILSLPFSYYSTFVIEEKFGFNKMTKKLFFTDTIKWLILWAIIWWLILWALIFIYLKTWWYFWVWAWVLITLFTAFMMMFHSNLIVPLFNKQTPLEKWSLRDKIEAFAEKMWFKLDNIYVMDWSKRSTKANAYFTGFWPKKRIVLFDTLIKQMTDEELVAVLAHEIWHYQKKHTLQMLVFSIIQTWIIFFILGLALNYAEFSLALGWNTKSFWLSLVAFSILFTPISMIFGIIWNIFSRKNEYEADEYSAVNYKPKELKNALIKLSKNNLSNLTPHPAYEFFYYSHPVVLKRIAVLEKYEKENWVLWKIKWMFGKK